MELQTGRSARELLGADPVRLLTSDPWATGFGLLDVHLGGGLHSGELVLLGGAPGVGKTTLALQMAAAVAGAGGRALYLCYEHGDDEMLTRLLLMEAGLANPYDAPLPRRARPGDAGILGSDPRVASATAALTGYGD